MSIPVIDLFSGPGGLGEGFAGLNEGRDFRIVVSAEMDSAAHETLRMRSYFRLLQAADTDLSVYYEYCRGTRSEPWDTRTRSAWAEAGEEARQITLGTPEGNAELDRILSRRLGRKSDCVLIGGPPCQAYSLVGRSRNMGKADYRPEDDHRHFLYREYLRVIQQAKPAVFVMENVKGILSSQVGGRRIFQDILLDLVDPDLAMNGRRGSLASCYQIHSLVLPTFFRRGMDVDDIDPREFVIRAEEHGVPQARHRVILLGIREDICKDFVRLQPHVARLSVAEAIGDLPRVRSRLSRIEDSPTAWARVVTSHMHSLARHASRRKGLTGLADVLVDAAGRVSAEMIPGGLRILMNGTAMTSGSRLSRYLGDLRLRAVLNHEARGHMPADLRRYAYAAAFADRYNRSPKGHEEFNLPGLAPDHANWETGKFADRFRVQVGGNPATTVTSHIAKDGHYFIHPDATQCRSLTVREAARLQTFPDNYFFQGNRTQQFHQVGNAVPPMLASQIARLVANLFGMK